MSKADDIRAATQRIKDIKAEQARASKEANEEQQAAFVAMQLASTESITDAINSIKIDMDDLSSRIAKELGKIKVESPKVTVPKVTVPKATVEVKIPPIKVPEPKVTVNIPEQKAPVVNIPETVFPEFPSSMDVGLGNFTNKKPLPVMSVDQKGNFVSPVSATGGKSFSGLIKTRDNGVESSWDGTVVDGATRHAYDEVASVYGDVVRVKPKSLFKFGRNENVGTTTSTIMTLPVGLLEGNYVNDNLITHFASKNAGDSTYTITVEGHTLSGGNLTFTVQSQVINGTSTVALTTPLARITRAYTTSGNLEGPVTFGEDTEFSSGAPIDTAKIHLIIPNAENQSQKASTSLSSVDYWFIDSLFLDVLEKTANTFVQARIEARPLGQVFRPKTSWISASISNRGFINFDPFIIIPKNSDVCIQAIAASTGIDVAAGMNGYLAIIQ